jgi:hypothetical protein
MRRRSYGKLTALAALALLVAACGLFEEEDEYICEPLGSSEWTATATPRSGNCPQEWVDWGKTELLERTFVYEEEGLECGSNNRSQTVRQNTCVASFDEDILVAGADLHDTFPTLELECDDGGSCFQGYSVEYTRVSFSSTNND